MFAVLDCAVRDELVVFALLPVGIGKVDVTHDVASGGEDDQPGAIGGRKLRDKEPGEFEVPEMVCPDLQFEPIVSTPEGGEHDPGVVHQNMQSPA